MIGVVCTRFAFVIGVGGQEFVLSRLAHVWVWMEYYEEFCNCNCTASEKLAAISETSGRVCSRLCHEESCHIAEAIARLLA